jgi:hypothetical protein
MSTRAAIWNVGQAHRLPSVMTLAGGALALQWDNA